MKSTSFTTKFSTQLNQKENIISLYLIMDNVFKNVNHELVRFISVRTSDKFDKYLSLYEFINKANEYGVIVEFTIHFFIYHSIVEFFLPLSSTYISASNDHIHVSVEGRNRGIIEFTLKSIHHKIDELKTVMETKRLTRPTDTEFQISDVLHSQQYNAAMTEVNPNNEPVQNYEDRKVVVSSSLEQRKYDEINSSLLGINRQTWLIIIGAITALIMLVSLIANIFLRIP